MKMLKTLVKYEGNQEYAAADVLKTPKKKRKKRKTQTQKPSGEGKGSESKNNDSLDQLVSMGIPTKEAGELLKAANNDIQKAVGMFFGGSTPQKADADSHDEDDPYVKGEAAKIIKLYPTITEEEAKGIVVESEHAADDILKEDPDYTDKFNDLYQRFVLERATSLVKAKKMRNKIYVNLESIIFMSICILRVYSTKCHFLGKYFMRNTRCHFSFLYVISYLGSLFFVLMIL